MDCGYLNCIDTLSCKLMQLLKYKACTLQIAYLRSLRLKLLLST